MAINPFPECCKSEICQRFFPPPSRGEAPFLLGNGGVHRQLGMGVATLPRRLIGGCWKAIGAERRGGGGGGSL